MEYPAIEKQLDLVRQGAWRFMLPLLHDAFSTKIVRAAEEKERREHFKKITGMDMPEHPDVPQSFVWDAKPWPGRQAVIDALKYVTVEYRWKPKPLEIKLRETGEEPDLKQFALYLMKEYDEKDLRRDW